MLERELEKKCRAKALARGCKFYKFVSPSQRSMPDRILLAPGGRIVFVELKAAAGRLTRGQKAILWMLEEMGFRTAVVRAIDDFERLLDEITR